MMMIPFWLLSLILFIMRLLMLLLMLQLMIWIDFTNNQSRVS
jgi:hypothetical protein